MIAKIRAGATAAGVDPDLMEGIYHGEGAAAYVGDSGSSFGPFQLHMGGLAGGGNAGSGMGDEFKKDTGLDPRDPKTVDAQIAWVGKKLKADPSLIRNFHGYANSKAFMAGGGAKGSTGPGNFNFMHGQFGAHGTNTSMYTTNSGRSIRLNNASAPHILGFLNEMESKGMPITKQSYDSFNDRKIRGGSNWSQHAYGNAVDLEATGFSSTPAFTAVAI